jgi:hypothetical protein
MALLNEDRTAMKDTYFHPNRKKYISLYLVLGLARKIGVGEFSAYYVLKGHINMITLKAFN